MFFFMHFFSFLTSMNKAPNHDSKTDIYVHTKLNFVLIKHKSGVDLTKLFRSKQLFWYFHRFSNCLLQLSILGTYKYYLLVLLVRVCAHVLADSTSQPLHLLFSF